MLQLLISSSCPRRPHPQFSPCRYFSISHFFQSKFSLPLVYFSFTFSNLIPAGCPNFFKARWQVWNMPLCGNAKRKKEAHELWIHPPSPSKFTPFCFGGLVRTKTFFTLLLGVAYSVNKSESSSSSEVRNYDHHIPREQSSREQDRPK